MNVFRITLLWIVLGVSAVAGAASAQELAPDNQQEAIAETADLDALFAAVRTTDWPRAKSIAAALDARSNEGDLMKAFVHAALLIDEDRCSEGEKLARAVIDAAPFFIPAYDLVAFCLLQRDEAGEAAQLLRDLARRMNDGPTKDILIARADTLAPSRRPRFTLEGSVTPSSNANRGTAVKQIYGARIAKASQGQAGTSITVTPGIEQPLYSNRRLALAVSLSGGLTHDTLTGGFAPSARTAFSATFLATERLTLNASPYVRIGFDDGRQDYVQTGLATSATFSASQTMSYGLSADLSHVSARGGGRDGQSAFVQLSTSRLLGERNRLHANLWVSGDERRQATLDSAAFGGEVEVEHMLENGLIGSAAVGGHRRYFRTLAPFTLEKQENRAAFVRVGLSHNRLLFGKVRPEVTYTYTRQWSNDIFSQYEAHDGGLRFKAAF